MTKNPNRPVAPHLQVYRWSPQMAISIFHRATGFILATVGMMTLLWWLSAIGGGADSYASFERYVVSAGPDGTTFQTASNWFFRLVALAVIFSFFQHMASGIRHLVLDIGAGYELKANRKWASVAFVVAFFASAFVVMFMATRFLGVW
jgi:succinate dehydrogenase / fumarate reductase cytochrome b subunit